MIRVMFPFLPTITTIHFGFVYWNTELFQGIEIGFIAFSIIIERAKKPRPRLFPGDVEA